MGRIVGIDLGTCFSAVAIPEERSSDGFLMVRECAGCSVILDRLKRRITPSVVAEDETGQLVVGYAAKARAGLAPEPIMFSKRYMGTEKTFTLAKQGTLRPEQVAAEVLRHLKQLAEQRLGEPIDEAVVTVPAYFQSSQKIATEEAAKLAGLMVSQIAQEPVAAALMYFARDRRDSLRIMTYDLGGGTFDVAIVEKRDGIISTDSIRAFDGDRYLGGSDFDKALAIWIVDQLNAQGYDLHLNLDDPADKVIFAKLMILAEQVKIALSSVTEKEIQEPASGIIDHVGNPVAIHLAVTREVLESLIGTQVEHTIQLCRRALAKASLSPADLDEIVMVGGSSRIPIVSARLEAEFGKTPRLVEPDLCVALGAAMLAGARTGPRAGCLRLDHVPAETDLPHLTVTGRVVPTVQLRTVQGCSVTLEAADGSYRKSRAAGEDGKFLFDAVPLAPESKTELTLSATAAGGTALESLRFSVAHRSTVTGGGLTEGITTNTRSKPISVQGVDGLQIIFGEGDPLVCEAVLPAETTDTGGTIRVPIFEGNTHVGEIVMTDLPSTLAVGSSVEVTLTGQENYQIHARAYVPSLGQEANVVIELPRELIPTFEELERRYDGLVARAENVLSSAGRAELFEGGKGKKLKDGLRECGDLLKDRRRAEPGQIKDRLDDVESLIRTIGAGWKPEPPRAVFEAKDEETQELYDRAAERDPKVAEEGYQERRAAIRAEAEKAYTGRNTAAWKDSYEKLVRLCDDLERRVRKNEPPSPPPDPAQLLVQLERELAAAKDRAEKMGRYAEFEADFKKLGAELRDIQPKAPDVMIRIRDWYTKFTDLVSEFGIPKTTLGKDLLKFGQQKKT